jgi:hypothetical protein
MYVSGPGTRSRSKGRSLFRAEDGKEKSMNRVAVVAITSISLWVGSLVDQEKLEYLIAGALFTLAMELVVKIITAIVRRIARPKVHSV